MDIVFIFLGVVFLFAGAESLVKGSASLAARYKVPNVVIGLTVVGWGTLMPEMIVSVQASLIGQGDIALGNVIGSNIANVGLILGLVALVKPIQLQNRIQLFDIYVMGAATLVFFFLFLVGTIGRGVGAALLALAILYSFWTVKYSKDALGEMLPKMTRNVGVDLVLITAGLFILVIGGHVFLKGAVSLAKIWEVSEAVIGLSLVALGTSLPELATSLVAAYRRHPEIALGNVIGSNIFNSLSIVGAASLFSPLRFLEIKGSDFAALFIFTGVLIVSLVKSNVIGRLLGATLFAGYLAYIFWLYTNI